MALSLRIMRIAFTGGVVAFAVFAQQMVSRDGARALEHAATLRWVNVAILAAAVGAILAIQRRHDREPDPRRRQTLNVVAWAAGESTALFGIVHWLMVGSPIPFYVGLATMLGAFVLVPIRE